MPQTKRAVKSALMILPAGLFCMLFLSSAALAAVRAQTANLIPNASFEEVNSKGKPAGWNEGRWGANQASFIYPVAGYMGGKAAQIRMTSYTSGDAKWYFNRIPVIPGKTYYFSDFYQSDASGSLVAEYKKKDGSFMYRWLKEVAPTYANEWKKAEINFTAPPDVASLTIFHSIEGIGFLTVDNYSLREGPGLAEGMVSLNFDDGLKTAYKNAIPLLNARNIKSTQYVVSGFIRDDDPIYVSKGEVLAMERAGHEIGAHTRTHAHLTSLRLSDAAQEILGSKAALLAIGVPKVRTFAYPFGEYTDDIKNIVRLGFPRGGARATQTGFNNPGSDFYALKVQNIRNTTTAQQVQTWIDTALYEKTWLILVYHDVVPYPWEQFSTSKKKLANTLDYLIAKRAKVVTNAEGLDIVQKLAF